MAKDKNKKQSKEDNFLLYVPKKKLTEWEIKDEKVYLIFHHDKAIERFVRWLVKKPTVSDIELDCLGTQVWLSIDGRNNIYDIINILLKEENDTCESMTERVIMFLRYLNKKDWISFEKVKQ